MRRDGAGRAARLLPALILAAAALLAPGAASAGEAPPVAAPHPLLSERPPTAPLDIVLLVDASEEAATSSGADVNGDGKVDPGRGLHLGKGIPRLSFRTGHDSILAAELLAARRILATIGDPTTRVGVARMAQPFDPHPCRMDPKGPGAEVLQPLTFDRGSVSAALDRIEKRGARGASNLAEGLRVSSGMLMGLPDAPGKARPGARRIVLFFGYRAPSFPFGSPYHTSPEDIAFAERAAAVLGRAGIRVEVLTFGTGHEGFVVQRLARIAALTGGDMTPVPDPRKATFGLPGP